MCCLTCSYFSATEPPEHKAAREAGRCESSCGKEWSWATVFRYVQNHDTTLSGYCRLNPNMQPVVSWEVCGQHRLVCGRDNGWGLHAFDIEKGQVSLVEWARRQYWHVKRNEGDWRYRRMSELERTNGELRQQLAVARKRSASRLARLQKLQNKRPKPEPKLPEPSVLRLVAAE